MIRTHSNLCFLFIFLSQQYSEKILSPWRDSNPQPSEHRADALSTELQGLLGERGHLLRSYGLVDRLSCLKQALTGHQPKFYGLEQLSVNNRKFGQWFVEINMKMHLCIYV